MEPSSSNFTPADFEPTKQPKLADLQKELEEKTGKIKELKKEIESTRACLEEKKKKNNENENENEKEKEVSKKDMETLKELCEQYNRLRKEYNETLAKQTNET